MRVATSVFALLDIKETTVMVSSFITLHMVYGGFVVYWENISIFLSFLKYIHQGEQDNKSLLVFELMIISLNL